MTGRAFHDPALAELAALADLVGATMQTEPAELAAILDRDEPGGTEPAEPAAAVEPAEPAVPAAAAPPEPAGTADDQPDAENRYSQGYVENLRRENQAQRERAKAYEDVFGGVDEGDKQIWLDVVKLYKENPVEAARWMATEGQGLLARLEQAQDATQQTQAGTPPSASPGATGTDAGLSGPLTADTVAKIVSDTIAAREQKQTEARIVDELVAEAKGLGYDTESARYVTLLTIAGNKTNGDIAKAHEILKAEEQKLIDDFVAKKAAEADTGVGGGGAQASQEREIKSLKDARGAMEEFLDAQLGSTG